MSTKKFLNYLLESTRNSNNVVILLNSRKKAKQNKTKQTNKRLKRLSLIVRVNVVLNRNVVVDSD